jgi:hypothetical protein
MCANSPAFDAMMDFLAASHSVPPPCALCGQSSLPPGGCLSCGPRNPIPGDCWSRLSHPGASVAPSWIRPQSLRVRQKLLTSFACEKNHKIELDGFLDGG